MSRKRKPRSIKDGAEYRFKIDAYTPETMPMHRLAQYMAELSVMLGERDGVHFRRIEDGSTVLVHRIEREAVPKVRARITRVRAGDAPTDALRAYRAINKLLRDDDAIAVLRGGTKTGVVIRFPGREEIEEEFASVKQYGSIDGVVTWLGGSDETAHITLETDGQQVSYIYTSRPIAKALGSKLWEPVRLHGQGRWRRDNEGNWSLINFKVESFEPLDNAPLSSVVNQLRDIPLGWGDDTYSELGAIRHGQETRGKRNGGH